MSTPVAPARKTRRRPAAAGAFKSPLPDKTSCQDRAANPETLRNEIQLLQQKINTVQDNIDSLGNSGYEVSELNEHVDKMHQYNEIKDVGQMVLGRLAEVDGVRTRDLYPEYGLDIND